MFRPLCLVSSTCLQATDEIKAFLAKSKEALATSYALRSKAAVEAATNSQQS